MKAMIYTRYGPPEVLQLEEIAKPVPQDDEVLVKVHAVSVNFSSAALVRGKPFAVRLIVGGIRKPKFTILGNDIAGRVEAVGRNVKQFRPGDAVFGDLSNCGFGAFAEYATVPQNVLALKPANSSFEEAAAVPEAGVVALQGLRDHGQLQPGQRVLINGASGGIGSFAVQIAKAFGAEVTGVSSTSKLDTVRSIGADHVIDYTQEDFTRNGQQYDVILDIALHRPISDYKRSLTPEGNYVAAGGSIPRILQSMILGPLASLRGNKKLSLFEVKVNQEDLAVMADLVDARKVIPVIGDCYPLAELSKAIHSYEEGRVPGKVVVSI